ncbi:MAG: HAMP domain-containing protein [Deltaproteobacteria bacterium]|nr:HAMP domain-containing protein [Deltaproteobacteria bacterium]
MTLRLKLFLLIAGITVFPATGVTAVALWRDVQRGQELLYREGAMLAATVAPGASRFVVVDGARPEARDAIEVMLQRLLRSAPLERAWAVDRSGAVIACASTTGEGDCPPGMPSAFAPAESPVQALRRLLEPEGIVASAPLLRDEAVVGAIRIAYAHEEVVGSARRLAWSAAVVAGFWILLGQAFGAILFAGIARSITRVVEAAEQLAEGEQGLQLDVPQDRELADLVVAFNRMSARLKARRDENERLIGELEARVAQKTREVLRADRLATLGGIAAGFAHELGNSLNVIRGYTGVVLRELPEDHANKPDLEAVKRETKRAASLMERFLVFARSKVTTTQRQSIEPVVREAVEVVGPAAAQAKVETSVEVEGGVPPIQADAELLRQAFLNLGVNAIQAMQPGGGKLTVKLRRDGTGLVVEFQDSGPGMDAEVQKHVFEPFYTTKASGTGLGLAIVRQAAETHGGTVEVESAPGRGALFRVRLPGEERKT